MGRAPTHREVWPGVPEVGGREEGGEGVQEVPGVLQRTPHQQEHRGGKPVKPRTLTRQESYIQTHTHEQTRIIINTHLVKENTLLQRPSACPL